MTPNEFRAIVARIELKNPPFACELKVHNSIADDTAAEFHVMIRVADRDTGVPTFIMHSFTVPPNLSADPISALWAVDWVFDRLGRVFHHELRECFHVAERRFREPHPAYDDRDDIELSRAATPAWVESLCRLEPEQLATAISDNPSIAATLVRALRYERKHGREGS